MQLAPLNKLDIFLNSRIVLSAPASVAELSWQERAILHQVMKKAQEAKEAREDCDKAMDEATEMMKKLKDTLESLKQTAKKTSHPRKTVRKTRHLMRWRRK